MVQSRAPRRPLTAACLAAIMVLAGAAASCDGAHAGHAPAPPQASVTRLLPGANVPHVTSLITPWRDRYWFAVATLTQTPPGVSPGVRTVVYRWIGAAWVRQASVLAASRNGSVATGGIYPPDRITAAALTGASTPDFLVHTLGADTQWVNVISRASGRWAVVPFRDTDGETIGENEIGVSGKLIITGNDNCIPDCANGHVTNIAFRYASGAFVPAVGPGSCTGPALAQAAHAYALRTGSASQSDIIGFACTSGYALAAALRVTSEWAVTFRSSRQGWTVLHSASSASPADIPARVYRHLQAQLSTNPQNLYYPF